MNTIRITLGLALAALAAPALGAQTRITGPQEKATAPIAIDLSSSGAGDLRHLRVSARTTAEAPKLTVAVAADDGLALSGEAEWKTTTAEPGAEIQHELEARVTGPGEQRVVVTATLGYADGSTETAVQVFVLNLAPEAHGFIRLPQPGVVTGPGGRKVLEVMTGEP